MLGEDARNASAVREHERRDGRCVERVLNVDDVRVGEQPAQRSDEAHRRREREGDAEQPIEDVRGWDPDDRNAIESLAERSAAEAAADDRDRVSVLRESYGEVLGEALDA